MASLQIEIDLVLKKFEQGLRDAGAKLEKFSKQATKVGKTLSVAVTAPIVGLGIAALKSASDTEEAFSKFDTIFRDIAAQAETSFQTLRNEYGLSSLAAKTLLGDTGDLLTGFGFSQEAALDLATDVNKLAVDLASFTNFSGGAKGASEALTKALLGERESVKALGIAILEEDVKKQVAINTARGLIFETERQAKAQATLDLAIQQSGNAIGDYARTQGSFANQLRLVQARLSDLAVEFGQVLLPIATQITTAIAGLVTRFSALDESTKRTIVVVAGIAAAIGPLLLVLGSLGLALPAIASGVAALGVAINFALGPIGLTITAIAALTAGIIAINNGWRPFEILVGKSKGALDAYEISTNKVSEAQEILNKLQKNYVDLSPSQIAASKENILAKIDEARATLQLIEAERLLAVEEAKKITTSDIVRSILLGNSKEQERVNQVNEEAAKQVAGINEELNKLTVSLLQVPAEAKAASDAVTTFSETGKTAFEVFSDLADLGNEKVFQKFADDADAFNRKLNETLDLQNRLSGAESNLELKSSGIVDVGVNLSGPPVVEVAQIDESSKTRFITSLQTLGADIDRIVENTITGSIADLGFSIGQALASGENVFSAIGQSLLNSLGDFLGQLGKQLIAYGVAGVAFSAATKGLLNPITAAPSALALIGAGTALTLISGAIAGVLRGGGATGGSGAGGSTAGAGQSFEGTGTNNALVDSFGALEITGQSKIQGTDIIISYEKAQRANGR